MDAAPALQLLYSHLVKRVFDEFGIEVNHEWEQRVLSGEHDVPLPDKDGWLPPRR